MVSVRRFPLRLHRIIHPKSNLIINAFLFRTCVLLACYYSFFIIAYSLMIDVLRLLIRKPIEAMSAHFENQLNLK